MQDQIPQIIYLPEDESEKKKLFQRVSELGQHLPALKAQYHKVIIIDRLSKTNFVVGMIDVGDGFAREEIARILLTASRHIKFVSLDPMAYDVLFREVYSSQNGQKQNDNLTNSNSPRQTQTWRASENKPLIGEGGTNSDEFFAAHQGVYDLTDPEAHKRWLKASETDLSVHEFLLLSLMEFVRSGASDYHMEAGGEYGRIRFRLDGVLFERWTKIPLDRYNRALSGLADMANQDRSQMKFKELNAVIKVRILLRGIPTEIELRFSSVPATPFPEIVLRLQADPITDLKRTGLYDDQLLQLEVAYNQPQGIIIVTGPTGSGKTNTLNGICEVLHSTPEMKICEIGDPIEIYSKNRTQVNVTPYCGWFNIFYSFLRQDPDVIVVGEMRKKESVAVALDAALTGHLVLGTFHTTNVETTFTRLYEMGIARDLVGDGLTAIHSQRLVRVLCTNCRERDNEYSVVLGSEVYKAVGCHRCYGSGYKGRTAVAEILVFNDEIRSWVRGGMHPSEIVAKASANKYFKEMSIIAGRKMAEGLTSYKEVNRVLSIKPDAIELSGDEFSMSVTNRLAHELEERRGDSGGIPFA